MRNNKLKRQAMVERLINGQILDNLSTDDLLRGLLGVLIDVKETLDILAADTKNKYIDAAVHGIKVVVKENKMYLLDEITEYGDLVPMSNHDDSNSLIFNYCYEELRVRIDDDLIREIHNRLHRKADNEVGYNAGK